MNTLSNSKTIKMSPLLLVADINRSIEFYTLKLQFDIDFRYEGFYAGIIKDGYSIHLKVNDGLIEERKKEDVNIIFSVSNIEALFEEYSNNSIGIIQSLRDMPYGKEFYIVDPDGNIIAFVERITN